MNQLFLPMRKNLIQPRHSSAFFAAITALIFVGAINNNARAQFTFASDNAGNYGASWDSGEDGGSGFGGWGFSGGGVNAGSFLGNPNDSGIANTNMGSQAFGMFSSANNSGYANRSRGFDTGMGVGDTFSFDWGINWDVGAASGAKGFDIKAGGSTLFTLINRSSATITFTNLLNSTSASAGGGYGTNNMRVTLTRTSTGYTFEMTSRSNNATYSTNISTSLTVDNFNFFIGDQENNNANRNMFFDNLSITNSGVFSQGGAVTNNNAFGGTGNLSVGNSTTLTLGGGLSYTGTTTISNGSTLLLTNTGTVNFASALANSGALVISNGTGQVNLSGSGTGFTGTITVANGSLEAQTINALSSTDAGTTVNSGGTLRLWNASGITFAAEALSLNGSGVSSGGALRNITNNNIWQGAITLAGASRINSDAGTLTIDVASGNAISGSFDLTVGGAGNVTINDNANLGTGKLIKDGNGILTLGAVMGYTNNTEINQGTLTIGSAGGINSASTIFIGSGLSEFGSANAALSISNTGTLASAIRVNTSTGAGTRTLNVLNTSGTATLTGGIALSRDLTIAANSGGNLLITNTALSMSNNTVNADITVTGANNVTIGSAITAPSGASDITMSGSGILTVSGNNSANNFVKYILNSGKLSFGALNNIGQVGSFYADKINFNGGTLLITDDITIAADTFGMTTSASGGTIEVASGKTFTQNAAFSSGNAEGAFNKTGEGTLVLGVTTNQMNAVFNIRNGTVSVAGTGALGSGNVINLGDSTTAGRLLYTGATGSTSRTITNNAGGGIINVSSSTAAFTLNTGMVFNGLFTKEGQGTLILGGTGSGSGKTAISAGTLSIASAASLGANPASATADSITLAGGTFRSTAGLTLGFRGITIGSGGGTISVQAGTALTNAAGLNGSVDFSKDGSGSLVLSTVAGNYSGRMTINNGTVFANTALTSADVTVANNGVLGGSGTLDAVTVQSGGRIAPGNSAGNLSVASLIFEGNSGYNWELDNVSGTAGTNWDLITVGGGTGIVTFNNTTNAPLTIYITGPAVGFNNTNNYDWTIIDAGTLTGFEADSRFAFNYGTINGVSPTGAFSVSNTNGNLLLSYRAASEVFNVTVAANTSQTQSQATGGSNVFSGTLATLNKLGAGTLVMTNTDNSYTGVTTVKEGTLQIDNAVPASGNSLLGNASSAVVIGDTTNAVAAGFNFGAAVQNDRGLSIIAGNGAATRTISTTINSGTATQFGTVVMATNATYSAATNGTLTVSGVISGSGNALITNSPGRVVFSGANTYAGTTTVTTNTTLVAANSSALGTTAGNTVVNSGGTLAFSNNISEDEALSIAGLGVGNGGALRSISGANTNTGTITLSANATIAADAGASLQLGNIDVTGSNHQLSIVNEGTVILAGNFLNMGTNATFFKNGAGSLIISNTSANTGGGQLQVGAGSVTLAAGTFSTNTLTDPRGLDLGFTAAGGASTNATSFFVNQGVTMSNTVYVASGTGARIMGTESTNGTATFTGEIYLDNTLRLTAATNGTAHFQGAFANNGNIVKVGDGTVLLSANNAIGNVTISNGTLAITNGSAIPSTSLVTIASSGTLSVLSTENMGRIEGTGIVTVASGQTLTNTITNTATFGGQFQGAGVIRKAGVGSLTLTGGTSNSIARFEHEEGVVLIGTNTGIASTYQVQFGVAGTKTIAASGANNFTVSQNNNFFNDLTIGQTSVNTGSLTFSGGIFLGDVGSDRQLTINGNHVFSGVVSGQLGMAKLGSGTLTLSGNNSLTGDVGIDAGTLALSGSGNLATAGRVNVGSNSILDISGVTGAGTTVRVLSEQGENDGGSARLGSKVLTVTGGAANTANFFNFLGLSGDTGGLTLNATNSTYKLTLYGASAYTGTTTVGAGTLETLAAMQSGAFVLNGGTFATTSANQLSDTATMTFNGGAFTLGGNETIGGVTMNSNATVTVGSGVNFTVGAMSGSGALTKASSGTITFGAAASGYIGTTTLDGGTIRAGANNAIGTGTVTIASGAGARELAATGSTGYTLDNSFNLFNNAFTLGQSTGGTGSLVLGSAGKTFFLGNDASETVRVVTVNGSHTIAAVVTGGDNNRIAITGGGTLSLSAANIFTGGAQVTSGTLRVGNDAALGTGAFSFNFNNDAGSRVLASSSADAYTLNNDFNVFDNVITIGQTSGGTGSLTLGGTGKNFNLGSDGTSKNRLITVNGSHTIAGNLIGGANNNLVKLGDGTLTIGGATNSFAGGLYIDSGVVTLSGAPLSGGNVLDIGGGAPGNAVNASSATLRVSATNSYGRNIVINAETNSTGEAGARAIEFAQASGSASLTGGITAEKTFTANVANASARGTLSGVITGAGGLTKTGLGTLTLSGASGNSITNLTTVSAGTLEVSKTTGNAISGSVTVASGATLLLSASNQLDSQTTDVVTLSGGTIKRASGVSEVFGNLNVTAASTLDYSGGTGDALTFTGLNYTPSALLSLTLFNFTKGSSLVIQSTTDMSGLIGTAFKFDGAGGFGKTSFNGGTFTITAIPEPSTYLAAAGLLALFLWPVRRRLMKDTKSILGLRAPARDRLEAYRNA